MPTTETITSRRGRAYGAPARSGKQAQPWCSRDKQACKKGGYEALGFKNQGQCIKAVNNAKN
jgi:hypothetical protein